MKHSIRQNWIHLGLEATATVEPPFDGMPWYGAYGMRHASDGAEGRLVSMFTFTSSWNAWEMHPKGAEVVLCVEGSLTLVQRIGAELRRITLAAGEYAINERGVWHTADVAEGGAATALFITAGEDTQHEPRE